MGQRKKATTIFEYVIRIPFISAGICILMIMLSTCYDVVMRYFFHMPVLGVMEIDQILLLYLTFLGAAWVLRLEGHVRMDLVLNRLNSRNQALVNTITSIFCAIAWLVITVYGAQDTWNYFQTGSYTPTVLDIPKGFILVIIPIGSFMLFIEFIRKIYKYLESRSAALD